MSYRPKDARLSMRPRQKRRSFLLLFTVVKERTANISCLFSGVRQGSHPRFLSPSSGYI